MKVSSIWVTTVLKWEITGPYLPKGIEGVLDDLGLVNHTLETA